MRDLAGGGGLYLDSSSIRECYRRREMSDPAAAAPQATSPLPAWLLGVFERPSAVPVEDTKVFSLRVACYGLGAVLHLALSVIFFGMGVPWAGAMNLVSTSAFLVGLLLLRSGRPGLGTLIAWLEIVVHLTLFTVLTGLETGYAFYIGVMLVVPFSIFRSSVTHELWSRRIIVGVGVALAIALPLLLRDQPALWPLEPWQAQVVFVLNLTNVIVALVAIAYYTMWVTDRAEANLAAERDRSEALLLNILPPSIAEQLKAQPGTIARQYESVTVLFADICGFTLLSARISSQELVEMLNEVFSEFDRLAAQHGLEKIKTIGDAYMAACGLPEPREGHAAAVAAMGLDMTDAIRAYAARHSVELDIRVGIHTGPVVAGVIGVNKFAYDLWGDTVNTASRMESHGTPGRVHLSKATRDALGEAFELEARGSIPVKGKGEMETWFLVKAA
jgi:adenylate cyclase